MTAGFDPALAQGIGFDQSDLECNQRGALSPAQVAAVRWEHTSMGAQSHLAAIVMGVFYVGVAITCVVGAYRDAGARLALEVAGVFVVLGVVIVVATLAHNYLTRRHGPDLNLYMVEGVTRCHEDAESFRVEIGGVKFFVTSAVYGVLHDGRRYRIYYVEHPFVHWRKPVSAEALL
jgi:hypothetical protein